MIKFFYYDGDLWNEDLVLINVEIRIWVWKDYVVLWVVMVVCVFIYFLFVGLVLEGMNWY